MVQLGRARKGETGDMYLGGWVGRLGTEVVRQLPAAPGRGSLAFLSMQTPTVTTMAAGPHVEVLGPVP